MAARARRAADEEHPFGYGRERYVYAFVVSIILFSVGGVFSLYEGIEKFAHPHPLENWWLPLVVLVIAIGLEGFSLRTALKEARPQKGSQSWVQFVRRAKAPELPVVMLEDTAALLGLVFALFGVGLTAITGNGVFDAIGTMLIAVAAHRRGARARRRDEEPARRRGCQRRRRRARSRRRCSTARRSTSIIHIKTLYLGPDELMVGVKVAVDGDRRLGDVAAGIDTVEQRVRRAVPVARVIYVEPDVLRTGPRPPTEAIVIRAADCARRSRRSRRAARRTAASSTPATTSDRCGSRRSLAMS